MSEKAECGEGEQGYDDLGIDVDGEEEYRRCEAVKGPERQGHTFLSPFLAGKQKNLEPQQCTEEAHAEADDEKGELSFKEGTEGVKGQEQKRDSGGMKGIFPLSTRSGMGCDFCIFRHVGRVVSSGVIVAQVDISILEETVCDQEVVWLIP